MKDKIKALLGQGHSPELVATIIGCDPSYISQLLENETFRNEVSELRVQSLQAATERDKKWDSLEEKLLNKLHDAVDFVIKPREILAILSVANAAKRRGATATESITINNQVVNLLMPTKLTTIFTVNQNNQVIGVGDKSMLTMPSKNIGALLAESQAATQAQLEDSANESIKDMQQIIGDSSRQRLLSIGAANGKKEGRESDAAGGSLAKKSLSDYTAEELKDAL
jgi:KaiC/GvpD/RAD55 family RecA-like ATPase